METPCIPPFRNEQRWGNSFPHVFTGGAANLRTEQMISVNENPTRVWDLLLVLEGVAQHNMVAGSRVQCTFEITVGVGSSVAVFSRRLIVESPAIDITDQFFGKHETLVLPAASFIVQGELQLIMGGGQPLPMSTRVGVFASPRVPFLATAESSELFEEG